jgi:hypothetical protein
MPGPSIMVKILGDVAGLGQSFTQAGQKGQTAAQGMHSAFSGMLGTLNSTGVLGPFGSALQTADQSMQQMGAHAKDTGAKMMGIGGAAAGVGLALTALGSKDQAAHQQLQAAVAATGHSYDQYASKVEAAIGHQEKFGHTADQTQNALRVLTSATNSPTEALKLLNTATDLAAAKHEDLTQAATTLGKAYNGSGKVMKEFGIVVSATGSVQKELSKATTDSTKANDAYNVAKRQLTELEAADATGKALTTVQTLKLQDAQNKVANATLVATTAHQKLLVAQKNVTTGTSANTKALDELGKKLAGQASAQADTFTGHLHALRAEITDHISLFAQKYGPAITTAGIAMAGLGSAMEIAKAAANALKLAEVAQTVATLGASAATWALTTALYADPITLIAIAIGVVLVGAIVLIVTHLTTFKNVVLDVWHTVVIGFDGIKGAVMDVVKWIEGNWPLLLGILTGPFGLAIEQIITHWNDFMGFFSGLPGRIASVAGGMWNSIGGAFKAVINGIIDGWNALHFKTPSVDILGFHTPSVDIGMPTIPHLAQGGLITQSGLVYAHAGEAITPAPAGLGGPLVNINHAHFDELDLDVLMRRVAWLARSQGRRFSAA